MATVAVSRYMHPDENPSTGSVQRRDTTLLWGIAVLCFGVGDVFTTSIGLGMPGVFEAHPIAVWFFQFSPLGAMLFLKGLVFAACYVFWRRTPEPYRVGVPLGLAMLGMVVFAWNLKVLFLAVGL